MSPMRHAKAALALALSASLCAPASAQMRAAAAAAGSAVPRVIVAAPLTAAPSALQAAVALSAAPALSPALLAAPVAAAPLAVAPAAAAAVPAAAAPAAAPAPLASAPALSFLRAASRPDEGAAPLGQAPAAARSRWETFWSGSASRDESASEAVVPAALAAPRASRLAAPSVAGSALAAGAAVAPAAVPAAHGFASLLSHASPFLEAGAVLAGTYVASRFVHSLLSKLGEKKGLDRHQLAAIRLVTSVALWTGGAAGALVLGGAPQSLLTTALGAGGTILTLGLKDVLGNFIQGVNFLITRPFAIGARVQVDDQIGTVKDVTLTKVLVAKDDGAEVKIRHSTLAAKPVVVFGAYQYPDASLHLSVPQRPRFQGAVGAVWKSLDKRFWIAAAAFAVLLAAPAFAAPLAAGWAATVIHYALAASLLWLTRRVDLALGAAVNRLAELNGWRPETRAITRLAVSAALWSVGGGAVLRMIGVSWTALGASLGLTTLGVGLASNNFFGSVVQGGEVLFSKPFKVGDRIKVGSFEGAVEDMTLYHVVIKLDEGRHALVPYAVVRDATLVVQPGN